MSQTYNPTLLEKGLSSLFVDAAVQAAKQDIVPVLCDVMQSQGDNEKHAWIGNPPALKEMTNKSEVEFVPMSDTSYTITNKTWEVGVSVPLSLIEDDRLGAVARRVQQLAVTYTKSRNKLVIDTLINGTDSTDGLCYDGTAFFGNTHPALNQEGGTQDNLLSGSGVTATAIVDDFSSALSSLLSFKDEAGHLFHEGVSNFTIVFHPSILRGMKEAFGAQIISSTSNVMVDGFNVKLLPRAELSDANDWYLLCTDSGRMPLIFQDRVPLQFSAQEADSDSGFRRSQYLYKIRARYNTGYGFWQSAIKIAQ